MGNKIVFEQLYDKIKNLDFVESIKSDMIKDKIYFSIGNCYYKIKITIDKNYELTRKNKYFFCGDFMGRPLSLMPLVEKSQYPIYSIHKNISTLLDILNNVYIEYKNNYEDFKKETIEFKKRRQIESISNFSNSTQTSFIRSSPKKSYSYTSSCSDDYSDSCCGSSCSYD